MVFVVALGVAALVVAALVVTALAVVVFLLSAFFVTAFVAVAFGVVAFAAAVFGLAGALVLAAAFFATTGNSAVLAVAKVGSISATSGTDSVTAVAVMRSGCNRGKQANKGFSQKQSGRGQIFFENSFQQDLSPSIAGEMVWQGCQG